MTKKFDLVKGLIIEHVENETWSCNVCASSSKRKDALKERSRAGGNSNILRHFESIHPEVIQERRATLPSLPPTRKKKIVYATASKPSQKQPLRRVISLKSNFSNASLSAKPRKLVHLPKSRAPPSTIEELTARQNQLLMMIVRQNQKTNKILRQNQRLMKIVIRDHLKISPEDFEEQFIAEEEEERMKEDCQFELSEDEDGNSMSGIEDLIYFKTGPAASEEVEQEIEEMDDVDDGILLESFASTSEVKRRKITSKTSASPKKISRVSVFEMDEIARLKLKERLPIISVTELKAIDQEMGTDGKFRGVVSGYIRKFKVRGGDTAELVEENLLEEMVNVGYQSRFIAEVQKPIIRRDE